MQIRYGGLAFPEVRVDFPEYIYRRNPPDYVRQTLQNQSASGVVETLSVRTDTQVELAVRWQENQNPITARLKRLLQNWQQYAMAGYPWFFALDKERTVYTTVQNNPQPSDIVLNIVNPASMILGGRYVIRNAVDLEVVEVVDLSVTTVTLKEPLQFRYFEGDRFRDEMFWPGRLMDKNPIIIEKPPLWYDIELRFNEDVNTI